MTLNISQIKKILIIIFSFSFIHAQENLNNSKFKQLHEELPTPNVYRTASGAPGHEYYQQKADYMINVELDEKNHIISGDETITYTNNSPGYIKLFMGPIRSKCKSKKLTCSTYYNK